MIFQLVRRILRKNLFLRKFFGYYIAGSGFVDAYFKNYSLSPSWKHRLQEVLQCEDNRFIERVKDAGKIRRGKQIMHNGLRIHLGSYYGPEYSVVLKETKGVHEPQEERVFGNVLDHMQFGATMLELGSFWSFYSMWFNLKVPGANNYMVEPDSFNLGNGKRNFKLNKMKGTFIHSFIGKQSSITGKVPTLCVDDILREKQIQFVDILHSDIQGYEYEMLQGALKSFENKQIGYIFISTHSDEVHYKCLEFLLSKDFIIIANADIDQTYSEDGLIVGRASYYTGIDPIDISLKATT